MAVLDVADIERQMVEMVTLMYPEMKVPCVCVPCFVSYVQMVEMVALLHPEMGVACRV